MSHCAGEDHEHGHGGHGHDHGHDHSHDDDLTPAIQSSLYKHIDFDKIVTYNEAEPGSGKAIIRKTWEERLDTTVILESDSDEQLLIDVPFTGNVRLHSILIRSDPSPTSPKVLKVFINRDDLDFSGASESPCTQKLEIPLQPPGEDAMEIPVKRALFNNVNRIVLFLEENHSGGEEDVTKLTYVGFKGDFLALRADNVVKGLVYEAAPNPADHRDKNLVPGENLESFGFGRDGTF